MAITICCLGLAASSTAKAADARPLPSEFQRLVKEKGALEERIAQKQGLQVPSQVGDFFASAGKGDWNATSNLFKTLQAGWRPVSGDPWLPRPLWNAILETYGAYEKIEEWSPEFLQLFSDGVVKSIPSGSILLGGNDAGRFGAILYSKSHSEGRPFFTLCQSALSDESYLGYLRDMYGEKIHIPTTNELNQCIAQYTEDAGRRLKHDRAFPTEPRQLKPGEDVQEVEGKVKISGYMALTGINAVVARLIFEKNPARDFYYVESFPFDWVNPHLTPHRFIFKVERQPVAELSRTVLRADRKFWTRHADKWLGAWLKPSTSVSDVTNFVVRTFVEGDMKLFKGDPHFIRDRAARETFSRERGAVGALYFWRSGQAKTGQEREGLIAEADFALRQAFVFAPENPVAMLRYVNVLSAAGRVQDALCVAGAGRLVDPGNRTYDEVIAELRRMNQTLVR